MQKASAFVPAHISGFFQVCDEPPELERKGSRNCGPCLDIGVITEVKVEPARSKRVKVYIDGKPAPWAQTSLAAAGRVLDITDKPFEVKVAHRVQVPMGAGYGASGAGALGVALALPKALGLNLPREESVEIAHVAEVECRTGLGDVGPQSMGGLVMGLEPGAPPHGRWKHIEVPANVKIVCGTLGPIQTREFLENKEMVKLSKKLGGVAIERLSKPPSLESFMDASRAFAEKLGLLDEELRTLMNAARSAGAIDASMVMLGRAVFAPVKTPKLEAVKRAFLELLSPSAIFVASVDALGARPLRNHPHARFC